MATETLTPASRRPVLDRLRRDRRAQLALPILLLLALAAALRPFMTERMRATDTNNLLAGPSAQHLLGTDELGRDVLARITAGALVTTEVATITVGAALVAGTVLGLLAGYRGGWLDAVIMRVSDGLLAFPLLVLALTVVAALGPGLRNALIAIAVVTTPRFARVVRGEVLSLRTREWVSAARIVGVPQSALMRRHLLPHLAGTLLVFAALQVSTAIMAEAALSFLGLSVQPPQPSWGAMVASGTDHLSASWSLSVFPGLAILLTVAAFNMLADALRDALDAHRPQLTPPR
ncbi:ABC transporter permease subunit [Streptomyces sp. SID5770]|uniref:ABC transporter permease n=1 Tax=Streptomyces sp. SID5770 TaxID=2690308 RepID=UPI00136D15D4|nr:ABC transporter permease [Streptomyces sp. SID5770]MZE55801.1 ABC transporter permease subunit [Streptomyces sp. SID5770]